MDVWQHASFTYWHTVSGIALKAVLVSLSLETIYPLELLYMSASNHILHPLCLKGVGSKTLSDDPWHDCSEADLHHRVMWSVCHLCMIKTTSLNAHVYAKGTQGYKMLPFC